jgi:uncharacterized protein YijF (DUF1287 family)
MKTTCYLLAYLLCCTACNTPAVHYGQYDGQHVVDEEYISTTTHPVALAALALTNQPYVVYDASYQSLAYPMGDVPADRGVCADVVVRALRICGYDLQQLVHEDMKSNFSAYPNRWGLRRTDRNIDHRRVPNLMTFFERQGKAIAITQDPTDYLPGDIVAWQLSSGLTHIGIVVAGQGYNGWPLVVHNIGRGQVTENVLFSWKVIGHYRYLR